MKNTVEHIYWVLFIICIGGSIHSCGLADRQDKIIQELKTINTQLEKMNE